MMTLLDRLMFALLRPRGKPIPAGVYTAMILATYTPEGPTGSIRFKLTAYDRDHRLIGPSVLRHPAVLPALQHAHTHDPHPVVRKIASWYVPGGPIYKRLAKLGKWRCDLDAIRYTKSPTPLPLLWL